MQIRFEGGPWDGVTFEAALAPGQVILLELAAASQGPREDYRDELDYLETMVARAHDALAKPPARSHAYARQAGAAGTVVYRHCGSGAESGAQAVG